MFQVERLRVVDETLKQIEDEMSSGNFDDPRQERALVESIDDTVTDIKHWMKTVKGAGE